MEGHAVELSHVPQGLVVTDHADDVDGQALALGAEEQVGQAVALLRDHEEGTDGTVGLVQGPAHLVGGGELGDIRLQLGARDAGEDGHTHEEQAGLCVTELLGLSDVAAPTGQCPCDRVDDAGAVRAGQGEDQVLGVAWGGTGDWGGRGRRRGGRG